MGRAHCDKKRSPDSSTIVSGTKSSRWQVVLRRLHLSAGSRDKLRSAQNVPRQPYQPRHAARDARLCVPKRTREETAREKARESLCSSIGFSVSTSSIDSRSRHPSFAPAASLRDKSPMHPNSAVSLNRMRHQSDSRLSFSTNGSNTSCNLRRSTPSSGSASCVSSLSSVRETVVCSTTSAKIDIDDSSALNKLRTADPTKLLDTTIDPQNLQASSTETQLQQVAQSMPKLSIGRTHNNKCKAYFSHGQPLPNLRRKAPKADERHLGKLYGRADLV